jgi:hypothetical protein
MPARLARPEPKSSMEDGSGTGVGESSAVVMLIVSHWDR